MIITSFSGDSVLAQIRFQIAIRTIPSPLTGICYPLVNTATVGQTVTWIASPDNGNPPYSYNWSGTDGLSSSLSTLQKVYTSPGTKTATVIITSEGRSSLPIPCVSSVIITAPSGGGGGGSGGGSSGGGGGGGSSSGNSTPPPSKKDLSPILDSAPSEDVKTEIPKKDIPSVHPECHLPENPTFQDAKDYLVCDNVITKRNTETEYEYERNTYRKELLAIATKIHLKNPDSQEKIQLSKLSASTSSTTDTPSSYSYHFLDVGVPGQPEWVQQTVEMGVVFGLISNQNQYFRPDDASTRAESFAMLMKAVCMDPDQSIQKNWQQRVYEIALRNGITSRSWSDFRPNDRILRQELFLITARLDRWKDETGGCDKQPVPEKKPLKNISTIIEKNNDHPSCFLPENPTAKEAEKYLTCDNLLSASQSQEKYNDYVQRIKVLGLGLEVFFKHRVVQEDLYQTPFTLQYLDIGIPGQEPWIVETVTQGVRYGLISNTNRYLRPHDYVTRGEVLRLLLRSVCMMDINQSIQATKEGKLYEIAYKNGITQMALEDFDIDALMNRGELFIAVAKLDRWKDATGGCDTYTDLAPKYNEILVLDSAPKEPEKTPQNEVTNTQKPGTFGSLYENETERVYTYIVKSGGIPDGVRAQYLRVFGRSKVMAARIKIHDISGVEYPEDRWLLGGELVYVTFKK